MKKLNHQEIETELVFLFGFEIYSLSSNNYKIFKNKENVFCKVMFNEGGAGFAEDVRDLYTREYFSREDLHASYHRVNNNMHPFYKENFCNCNILDNTGLINCTQCYKPIEKYKDKYSKSSKCIQCHKIIEKYKEKLIKIRARKLFKEKIKSFLYYKAKLIKNIFKKKEPVVIEFFLHKYTNGTEEFKLSNPDVFISNHLKIDELVKSCLYSYDRTGHNYVKFTQCNWRDPDTELILEYHFAPYMSTNVYKVKSWKDFGIDETKVYICNSFVENYNLTKKRPQYFKVETKFIEE